MHGPDASRTPVVLVGPMGAGKSTVGRLLAGHLGRDFVDLDNTIEAHAGRSVAEIFAQDGEAAFRAMERVALCERLDACGVLATGGGAVLDDGSRRLMRERAWVVHLQVDVARQLERLADDRERPLLARPDREAALHAMAAQREPLYRDVAHATFDTTRGMPDEIAATIAERYRALQCTRTGAFRA